MARKLDLLTPSTGTEIAGVDLAAAGPAEIDNIKRLLKERLVLVFRDQHLTREEHKALGRQFGLGVLHRYPHLQPTSDPEVLQFGTAAVPAYAAALGWHADLSSEPHPPSTSVVYLPKPPEGGGGDTIFANMYLAYETLSDPIKELVGGLSAIHDGMLPWTQSDCDPAPRAAFARTEHPVTITHPGTGRRALWVNRAFTARLMGVSARESRHLLEMLFQHVESNPDLHCRVRWSANTLVIWDNIALQYYTCTDYTPNSCQGDWVSSVGQALEAARSGGRGTARRRAISGTRPDSRPRPVP